MAWSGSEPREINANELGPGVALCRCMSLVRTALVSVVLLATSSLAAVADPGGGGIPDPVTPPCLQNIVVTRFSGSGSIALGGSQAISWSVNIPAGCTVRLRLAGQDVPRAGTLYVSPESNTTFYLTASVTTAVTTLGAAQISVVLPPSVFITRSNQQALLIQALATPSTTVWVANEVNMDLSYRESIVIANGVSLRGGRTARIPGPRLFTTTMPGALFKAYAADNVRISGLRIEGAVMGIGDGDLSRGIQLIACNNSMVDNNEISGWTGVGVDVTDDDALNRIDPVRNPETIHIRENFIHHNQYVGKFGYGVAIGPGAYAVVERNVFDWNRHAIASNGRIDTGYRAYTNLVLEHGGYHRDWPIYGWTHTHQFDMHGTDNCGIADIWSDALYNCGDAGHDVYLRGNSFLYTASAAFKLRGTPAVHPTGAFVYDNVFAHGSIGDAVQTTTGASIDKSGNLTGINGMRELVSCDFDGDGVLDTFLATGQSWWYSSGGTGAWTYLNTSKVRTAQLAFGQFDLVAGCDVRADGVVYSGGRPAPTRLINVVGGLVLAP